MKGWCGGNGISPLKASGGVTKTFGVGAGCGIYGGRGPRTKVNDMSTCVISQAEM